MRQRWFRLLAVTLSTLWLAGCEMALPSEEAGPAPAAVNSEGGVSQLRDPLIKRNFPDPDLLLHEGTYYAYATNHNLNNVQVATSKNLTDWEVLTIDALPNLPKWILEGNTWAPEVSSWPDGSFRMYFTARNAAFPKQCIGVATADNPLGPFEVQGNQMLVCPENLGGAIDAAVFFEEEIPYLIWKNDGNCCGIQTDLFIQQLSTDGLTLISEPVSLLSTSESWEGILIEAPTLVKREGRYHLFYSANDYYSQYYAVGHASSADLMGPYIKSDGPLLSSEILKDKVIGPGGQDLIQDQYGNWKIFFHGWNISKSARYMYSLDMQDVGWPE